MAKRSFEGKILNRPIEMEEIGPCPGEIWCKIISYLDGNSMRNISGTCTLLFDLVRKNKKFSGHLVLKQIGLEQLMKEIDLAEWKWERWPCLVMLEIPFNPQTGNLNNLQKMPNELSELLHKFKLMKFEQCPRLETVVLTNCTVSVGFPSSTVGTESYEGAVALPDSDQNKTYPSTKEFGQKCCKELLYESHTQGNDKLVYTCNSCIKSVETPYHCTECDDFNLCDVCYSHEGHAHCMEKLNFDLDRTAEVSYQLQTQSTDNFFAFCDYCEESVETRYHCTQCEEGEESEDFDICTVCYHDEQIGDEGHAHNIDKHGFDFDLDGPAEVLYELQTRINDKFVYNCNSCNKIVESMYHCTGTVCHSPEGYLNCMERHGFDLRGTKRKVARNRKRQRHGGAAECLSVDKNGNPNQVTTVSVCSEKPSATPYSPRISNLPNPLQSGNYGFAKKILFKPKIFPRSLSLDCVNLSELYLATMENIDYHTLRRIGENAKQLNKIHIVVKFYTVFSEEIFKYGFLPLFDGVKDSLTTFGLVIENPLCISFAGVNITYSYTRVHNVWSGSKGVVTFGLIKILTHPC